MPTKNTQQKTSVNICDYEGSNYRTEFWEGQGREYEDKVERVVLRKLLPPQGGRRLLEVGAGFGRLTEEYARYGQVVLLDYSFSQLQYAQEKYGTSGRYLYVAADAYKLPFRPGIFDAAAMIRVIHHMSDAPRVLTQVRRSLAPKGVFILEHANKRNLKAMLRYALKKQTWNPYDHAPVEFVELNFDFHPAYIHEQLEAAQFEVNTRLPVSFFRLNFLKNNVPVNLLVGLDRLLQGLPFFYTPSIFVKSIAIGQTADNTDLHEADSLFVCPEYGTPLKRDGDLMINPQHGLRYAIRDGIYDFKAPLD